jgi:hypothetical protein
MISITSCTSCSGLISWEKEGVGILKELKTAPIKIKVIKRPNIASAVAKKPF